MEKVYVIGFVCCKDLFLDGCALFLALNDSILFFVDRFRTKEFLLEFYCPFLNNDGYFWTFLMKF